MYLVHQARVTRDGTGRDLPRPAHGRDLVRQRVQAGVLGLLGGPGGSPGPGLGLLHVEAFGERLEFRVRDRSRHAPAKNPAHVPRPPVTGKEA